MTIRRVSIPRTLAGAQSVSRPPAPPARGRVPVSLSPETCSSLVTQASQMPEVRNELVEAYKSRIQSGAYPTQETVDRLVDLMGGTWAANA